MMCFLFPQVPITMEEARKPMGLRKDLHIRAITEMPAVQTRWREKHGRDPTDADIQTMYDSFVPLTLQVLPKYGTLVDGCKEAIDRLRSDFGLKIGCTTGFTHDMCAIMLREAKKQGYVPDAAIAGDDVANGVRPKPFMLYRNLEIMDVSPIQAVVKVDDTTSGIYEAQEAGCWGVGVARWSNYMDIDTLEQEAEISDEEFETRLERSRQILADAGAHYVVDSIADLPDVCEDINRRLAEGERP
jgi:phosphonoacetaldehyde hydrolase